MGFDIHDSRAIRCAIMAVEEASLRTALMAQLTDTELAAYRRGVQDSLIALGLVFDIADLPFALPTPGPPSLARQQVVEQR